MSEVLVEKKGVVYTVIINRPEIKNCVNRKTADQLADAFRGFGCDPNYLVAVLCGAGGTFCAGADLKAAVHITDPSGPGNRMDKDMTKDGPMGPSRMHLSKPVIAAVSGYAVAGGMELALWCDMRVMEKDAIFGVFCRRFGVPLIDGGTQRLPRLIGMSRAMDLILTGRPVNADEALQIGLANRVVETGTAREEAEKLAEQIGAFPQKCMRNDRQSVYEGFNMNFEEAMEQEFSKGYDIVMVSSEAVQGASKFTSGTGRHGKF